MKKFLVFILLINGFLNSLYSQSQTGIASVRHLAHEGVLTKTGEFFSHDSLVASHRSIPFGSIVKITNLKNQKSVDVRINDRGPFIKGHIIDLSEYAGQQIGISNQNLAEVRLDVIKLEEEFQIENFQNFQDEQGEYTIKMGSFGDKENANSYAKRLVTDYNIDHISVKSDQYNGKAIYRVYVGKFSSRSIAEQYHAQLPKDLQSGYVTTFE
jgi:rare lipoprotein A